MYSCFLQGLFIDQADFQNSPSPLHPQNSFTRMSNLISTWYLGRRDLRNAHPWSWGYPWAYIASGDRLLECERRSVLWILVSFLHTPHLSTTLFQIQRIRILCVKYFVESSSRHGWIILNSFCLKRNGITVAEHCDLNDARSAKRSCYSIFTQDGLQSVPHTNMQYSVLQANVHRG